MNIALWEGGREGEREGKREGGGEGGREGGKEGGGRGREVWRVIEGDFYARSVLYNI